MNKYTTITILVILLYLLLPVSSSALYGYVGQCGTFITLNSCTYQVASCNGGSGTGDCTTGNPIIFQNNGLGTISSLVLNRTEQTTFESDNDDVTAGRLYYRFVRSGQTAGAFQFVDLIIDNVNGGTERRSYTQAPNLTENLGPGDYTFEIYFQSDITEADGDIVTIEEDNGGNFYQANFTLDVPPLPIIDWAFSAQKNSSVINLKWANVNQKLVSLQHLSREEWTTIFQSNTVTNFQYSPVNIGTQYFRLVRFDETGVPFYSPVQAIHWERNQIAVFPNPAQTIVHLQFPTSFKDFSNLTIDIFSITGQPIKSFSTSPASSFSFDISHLKTSIYTIVISNQQQVLSKQKLLIN